MPIYEYICHDCGTQFDALRNFREADQPISCTGCESGQTKRKLSLFYAHSSGGRSIANNTNKCSSCSGGSCTNCG